MIDRLFTRLGLQGREVRAWALYDWANSAFWTTVIVAVFPPFFSRVAADGMPAAEATARFALVTTSAVAVTAILSPILGAAADYAGMKKRILGAFMGTGVLATAAMVLIGPGDWQLASVLFFIGNIGVAGSITFYDSLLPHVARPEEIDRVSTGAFALGFLGGGILLVMNLAWIMRPESFWLTDVAAAMRLSFLSVAIWWFVFSLPLLRHVREPSRMLGIGERADANPISAGFGRLASTLRQLRQNRDAFVMLLAFLLYNDGIQTIIRMASIYGTEIGIDQTVMIASIVAVQFVGIPCTVLFGKLADRVTPKCAIFLALAIYTIISVLGYRMTSAGEFVALAVLVGVVQGGSQALSRSLFARMVPRHKTSEYFGFFSVFAKFAGVAGPTLFTLAIWATGSSRTAVLSVIFFFVTGAWLLALVDVERGERTARRVEADATAP